VRVSIIDFRGWLTILIRIFIVPFISPYPLTSYRNKNYEYLLQKLRNTNFIYLSWINPGQRERQTDRKRAEILSDFGWLFFFSATCYIANLHHMYNNVGVLYDVLPTRSFTFNDTVLTTGMMIINIFTGFNGLTHDKWESRHDNNKIMLGYGSRNSTMFVILLDLPTTCFGHCWVGHRHVEDKIIGENGTVPFAATYIKLWGGDLALQ
jgi:hypothetical protein